MKILKQGQAIVFMLNTKVMNDFSRAAWGSMFEP